VDLLIVRRKTAYVCVNSGAIITTITGPDPKLVDMQSGRRAMLLESPGSLDLIDWKAEI
jgi:hypothetical protein